MLLSYLHIPACAVAGYAAGVAGMGIYVVGVLIAYAHCVAYLK